MIGRMANIPQLVPPAILGGKRKGKLSGPIQACGETVALFAIGGAGAAFGQVEVEMRGVVGV